MNIQPRQTARDLHPPRSAPMLSTDIGRVIEFAPTLIYVYDQLRQQNEYSNRSLGEKLGYSAKEIRDMGDRLMPLIIHPEDLAGVFSHLQRIRNLMDGEVVSLEYRVKHKAGHWIWLLTHDTVFRRDSNGVVTQHIGSSADITAQKLAEEQAVNAEIKARNVNAELREFSYAISHDMKAPANTMQLILSELQETLDCSPGSDAHDLLSLANTTVTRMQRLVEDVLHYTQIIGQEINLEPVDLNEMMSTLSTVLKADIDSRCGTVNVGPLSTIQGSETQVQILFQNLIQNALKFGRPGVPPVIDVTAEPGPGDDTVIISVTDNGMGIPEEKSDEIFHLFRRLNNDEYYEGTGIGLATCRRIAINHKSEMKLTSRVGTGSTFSIELSLA